MSSSIWEYGTIDSIGPKRETNVSPAITAHAGKLWCAWVDIKGQNVLSSSYFNQTWESRSTLVLPQPPLSNTKDTAIVPAGASPALVEHNGVLHLVVPSSGGYLVHYQYDDDSSTWGKRTIVLLGGNDPCLAVLDGDLYCVNTQKDGTSYYASWTPEVYWSDVKAVSNEKHTGKSTLFVMGDKLWFVGIQSTTMTNLCPYTFDTKAATWSPNNGLRLDYLSSEAYTGITICPVATGLYLIYSFKGGPQTNFQRFKVSIKTSVGWSDTAGMKSSETRATPALTVFNNSLYCLRPVSTGEFEWAWRDATLWGSLASWMAHLNPDKSITEVNLPGTHDSCAVHNFVPRVSCQRMSIEQQLYAGIRYLDVRGGYGTRNFRQHNTPVAHHGPIAIGSEATPVYLKDVFQTIYDFLDKHTSEAVVVQLKCDSGDENTFGNHISEMINTDIAAKYWWREKTIPTLKQHANKILLVRRFTSSGITWGIDATKGWQYNTNSEIIISKDRKLMIQDNFNFLLPVNLADKKFSYVSECLDVAKNGNLKDWYINYSSAVSLLFVRGSSKFAHDKEGYANPDGMEVVDNNGVNGLLKKYFKKESNSRLGTVVMDWADAPSDLIATIVQSNTLDAN